jgi:hypothetical protein
MRTRARFTSTAVLLTAALAAPLSSPPVAAADGLPVVGIDARPMSAPGGKLAYVTRRAGRATALAVIHADSERTLRRVLLPGRLSVPAVAYDPTPSGITPDGRKLVLITPRRAFPRAWTSFAIVDTRRLRIRRVLRLRGDFSFDAISPDGRTLYLIHYPTPSDILRYEVRAYDLRAGRLLPEPIVDPREPGERMSGLPVTRATSPDGRWEYTLYDGPEYPSSSTRSTPSAGRRSASTSTASGGRVAASGARSSSWVAGRLRSCSATGRWRASTRGRCASPVPVFQAKTRRR